MKWTRVLVGLVMGAVTFALSGCGPSIHPEDIQAFQMPQTTNVTAEDYVLQPPDEIEVHCSKVPEIHMQLQRIRPDGKVSFEGIGEVEAAGKTVAELTELLKERVSSLYKLAGDNPIDVRVMAYRSKVFYVMGQVYLPGAKDYTGRDTVLKAVADARLNPMAWEEKIRVIRPSADKNVPPKIIEVNLYSMIEKGDTSKNVLLQEGDIVYVPPTILGSLALTIEEFVRPLGRAFSTVNIIAGPPQYR